MDNIYKILTPEQWEDFQRKGSFTGSPLDQKDGFIHAATEDQYPRILDKFFGSIRPLVLLKLDPKVLQPDALKIETNKPGGGKYPHIYGKIPLAAVVSHEVIDK